MVDKIREEIRIFLVEHGFSEEDIPRLVESIIELSKIVSALDLKQLEELKDGSK